jgi:hypothetical protein
MLMLFLLLLLSYPLKVVGGTLANMLTDLHA